MALRHEAVFMNAGSYVIRPKSSLPFLIWRRSVALIVPSLIGTSYDFPVRLSVIVRVSLAKCNLRRLRRVNLSEIAPPRCDNCHRRQGRRFGPQTPRTEALEERSMRSGEGQFAVAPPSLRTDEERRLARGRRHRR